MQPDPNSADYYRQREAQEREMAEKSNIPEIRSIHLKMAKLYGMMADEADRAESDRRP